MFISDEANFAVVPARKSSRYRITVPQLLRIRGVYDELTLEQNLSDAFYDAKIKRKHGKDCFVYELTRKEIERYCVANAKFDYNQLERFRKKKVKCTVKTIIATIDTKIEEPQYSEEPENHTLPNRCRKTLDETDYDRIKAALKELAPHWEHRNRFAEIPDASEMEISNIPYTETRPEAPEKLPEEKKSASKQHISYEPDEALDEWHSWAARNTFANPKREPGGPVFYQWPTDLPPEAE